MIDRKDYQYKDEDGNILMTKKGDRRLLANVPDPEQIRKSFDRRNTDDNKGRVGNDVGGRYFCEFKVLITKADGVKMRIPATAIDISNTGIQLRFSKADHDRMKKVFEHGSSTVTMMFKIPDGVMEEGMEKKVRITGDYVRLDGLNNSLCFHFTESLPVYFRKGKDISTLFMSSFMLCTVTIMILLMRYESVLYLQVANSLIIYSIIAAVFLLTRYLFGAGYRPVPVDPDFTPGVTVIIPCFNEEKWITRTIQSCMNQEYPIDSLEVIVVDDYSTDNSWEVIQDAVAELHREAERFKTKTRLKCVRLEHNMGKRDAMARGIQLSTKEFVAFVDSDSFLESNAIREIIQPFYDPQVSGVCGRTDVANTFTNGITKMQAVRYYISFRIMKAAESYFDNVLCLSGPLSCYRKENVLENLDAWLGQTFFGRKATFGDDRALTHMIVKNNRTVYQDTAICATIVPHQMKVFLKQQMRWKRSWLRESLIATTFMWKKEPFMVFTFYIGLIIPVLAPVIVVYNLLYVPFVLGIFPTTFLVGLFCMAMLMSVFQLIFRKSSIWLYGLWYCLFYEAVLLWQMPWAWVTFWVSNWGTRMTPADVLSANKKKNKAKKNKDKEAHDAE